MKKSVPVTNRAYLERFPKRPIGKNHQARSLGKLSQVIQGYFLSSEMNLEDFEKLERKKQIPRFNRRQSVDSTRVH